MGGKLCLGKVSCIIFKRNNFKNGIEKGKFHSDFMIAHGNIKVLYTIYLKEAYSITCLVTFGGKRSENIKKRLNFG